MYAAQTVRSSPFLYQILFGRAKQSGCLTCSIILHSHIAARRDKESTRPHDGDNLPCCLPPSSLSHNRYSPSSPHSHQQSQQCPAKVPKLRAARLPSAALAPPHKARPSRPASNSLSVVLVATLDRPTVDSALSSRSEYVFCFKCSLYGSYLFDQFTSLPSSNTSQLRFLNSPVMLLVTTRSVASFPATFNSPSEMTRSECPFFFTFLVVLTSIPRLNKLLGHVIISQGGVVPYINPEVRPAPLLYIQPTLIFFAVTSEQIKGQKRITRSITSASRFLRFYSSRCIICYHSVL